MAEIIIKNGRHKLSGVGSFQYEDEYFYNHRTLTANVFVIDGKHYGAFVDPDDGYRSYGYFAELAPEQIANATIYPFAPQDVVVKNMTSKSAHWILVKDPKTKLPILEIGTDYFDSYYPMAIFHYTPENMSVNKCKQ